MSKTIDALIITDYAQQYADTVLNPEDIRQGLRELRNGKIDDDRTREELYASELFFNLGRIAYTLSDHRLPEYIDGDNPLGGIVMRKIDMALPERTESLLPEVPGHGMGLERVDIRSGSLYTHDFLVSHSHLLDEFVSKTALANKIITSRRIAEGLAPATDPFAIKHAPELLELAAYDLSRVGQAFRHLS